MSIDEAHSATTAQFSEAIRSASHDAHERAEQSPFMRRLLGGEATVDEYADLVAQHYFIYDVLEQAALVMRGDAVAEQFAAPQLDRRSALERDLSDLLGEDWSSTITPNEATVDYVNRIRTACFEWPAGFVAHHYVRYLGDLSGGQIVRRILARIYGFADGRGLAFYHFGQIDNANQFKQQYRTLLDNAPWGPDERRRVIDEVIVAFECNARVLEHLQR